MTLSGSGTYTGQTQIGAGSVIVSNNAGLGTNSSTTARGIDLGLNVGDVSQGNNVSVLATTGITVPQSIYVAPNTSSATRTIGLSGSGTATFSNEIYIDPSATASLNGGSGSVTFSGALVSASGASNTGAVSVTGGTVVLSGANIYGGATTVTTGTLLVNGSTNASSAVTVASGARLGGSGTVSGAVSLSSGTSRVAPGSAATTVGTLTTGAFTFNSSNEYEFDITNVSGTAGTNWDLLTSSGAITISATSGAPVVIRLSGNPTGFASCTSYTWRIAGGTSISSFAANKFSINTTSFTPSFTGTFSVTNSGNDINLVYTPTLPQGSLTANGPFCATGAGQLTWTATSGTGPYTVVYNDGTASRTATSVVSGTAFATFTTPVTSTTTYTLVSVTDSNTCVRSSGFTGSSATITVNQNPTASNAGADQTSSATCGLTSVTLVANSPTIGTGAWSIISGAGGSVTTPSSNTSTFSGTAGTTYTLRWTISNSPCTASTDDVVITFNQNPTTSAAGPDQIGITTCGLTSVTLAANSPTIGTGAWSIVSGAGGSVTTPSSNTSTFTGTAGTTYTLRWTISNSPCTASTDDVVITFNQNPTASNAGADQTSSATCGLTSVTLAANSPTIGTGAWSIVSGAGGSVTTPSSNTSTFSGTAGTTYTLRWTISNSPCTASTDDVVITFNQNPTASNAGADQTSSATCGLTSVTLAANSPTIGTGAWSIVSGAGGSVTTPSSNTSTFSGTAGTTYTLRWTISNSPCTASTDDVVITFNQNPTASNAGADQTSSATCGLTSVTLAANSPTIGTGAWSIVSGAGGSVTTPSSNTSTFSGTAGTTYTLRWTISNSPCTASTDDVVITFNQNPTASNAGADQTSSATCGLTSVTLAANSPTIGTGAWSIVSGAGGSVTTPSSNTSTFSGTAGTTYTLRWTISNSPCTASTDDVVITFNQNPTASNAGADQTSSATCGLTSVTLAANSPTIGTGAWSIVSGAGGSVTTPSSNTSTFSGTAGTTYTLRWTISNSPCTASTDDVVITFNQNPTASNAGADQTSSATCGLTSVTLAANAPTIGTGAWSIVSGAGGTVTTPSSNTSTFSGTAGTTYTLRWTISNSPCTASTDDVVITFNQNPTASNAGADQTSSATCGLTSVTLAANSPTIGTGAWSIVSGAGGSVTTPSSNTSTFSGTAGTTYTLRWTISNSPCTASTDDVVITFNQNPTASNAGADQTSSATCGLTSVTLAANAPTIGTGAWSIVSGAGGTVTTPSSNTSTFSGTAGTTYTLRWTISNSPCTASTDDVVITFNQNPTASNAGADQTSSATCGLTSVTLAANSPTIGTGAWSIISGAGGTVTTPSSNTSTFSGTAGTTYTLRWTISNSPCTASTDDVVITFNQNPTTSAAGVDQTICSTGAATLAGNNPSVGTGAWSIVSGPSTSSAQFGSTSVNNTVFTPAGGAGVYTLRWNVSNSPCTASTDDVDITVNSCASTITTGTVSGSPFCAGATGISVPFTYSPSASFSGSIFKAQLSDASGSFASPTDLQTVSSDTSGSQSISVTIPSGAADGTGYRIRVVSDTPAVNGSDNGVNLSVSATPTASNAGPDQTSSATCGLTSVTLAANAPTVGTGAWSIVSGVGGTVTTPSSNTSTFSGTAGTTYTLRWTISNSPCTASTDDVVITFNRNPTASNAGADQTSSATCGLTSVTLAANSPTIGTGAWSIISGAGGTVTTPSSNTSTFSGTAGTTYTLRWTISNSPCTASTDDVVITFNQNPTASNAGADQTSSATCGLTSVTLAANAPTIGTGAWSIVSGAGGTVTTPSSNTSTFSGTAGTTYTLRWTISNSPCTASTDDVVITFNQNPTASNAGADQTSSATCGLTSVTLAANSPTIGTGAWSIISGAGGTVTTPSSNTSTFSGTAGTTYTLRWTISNSPCTASTDDVVITFNQNPTASNAGADQTSSATCGLTSVTLAANSPTIGTGAWSIVSGAGGSVTTPSSNTSTFSGTAGTTYTLRWTISNSPCTASTDDVVITFNQNPTASNAGADQTSSATCGLTSVTLAANSPTIGTGAWSIVSGAGGSVTTPSSNTSTFSGTAGTTYTLRWTISNSPCTASTDDVVITFNQNPTASNAGADQTSSATCGLTSVTLAANSPTIGTGAWSIVSGAGGSVTTPSSNTSTFSGTAGTTYTLRWTISNSPCTASTDDVVITFNQNPTASNAGADQTSSATCGLTSVTLAANSPTIGTGAWSIVSGAGGSVTTPSSNTSTFSGTAGTTYTLRWTISNSPCTASTDDVVITFNQNPTASNAGADQTSSATCGLTSVTLAANSPTIGTGAWSIVSGAGGSVTTPSSNTSTFSGTAGTTYTLRWTISNSPCTASTDDVVITFNQNPTASNAGADQTSSATCGLTSVTLAANAPTIGTGAWSIVSGAGGTVTTPSSNTSTFSGTAGTTYTLRWTISNSPCTASTDDVVITFNQNPTASNAGADQTSSATCGLTSVTLAANSPTIGTGAWSIVSGAGGSVTTPSSNTSTFSGTAGTTYTLRWTISNSPCTASTDDVVITFNQNPTASNAGADQTSSATCGLTSVTLAANAPTIGTGAWSIVSGAGGTVTTPSSNTSTFSGTAGTTYTLRWTISNSPCTASTDDVVITFNQNPTASNAGADQTSSATCGLTSVTLAANSPTIGTGAWSIISGAGGTVTTPSSNTSTFSGTAGTTYTLRWTISNSPCTASTDDVVITFNQNPTTATNGSTQTICTSGTATLSGNNPSIGTGAWTVVSGPSTSSAQFASTSVFNTVFTPAGGAGSYLVRWTISNSPCTASTADATITVTTSSGGTATASLSSVCLGDSTSISLTGHSGTIQWQRSENSGTSWTSISGATSSTYTTPSLNVATSYRAVVTNGSCASANSTVAAVSISEANQSNAGNATYNTTWSNGQNDSTTGFGAWTLSATGGAGFFSSGSSDVNNANTRSWGMYAGGTGGGNVASATRTVSMGMGNKIAFSMDNGSITSGGTIGFGLQNASGQNLMELYFVGGNTFYTLNDNAGANATSLGYTTGGLDITVTYTAVNTYSVTITGKGGSTVTYTSRTFSTQGGGQLPAQIRFFNAGAGSGGSFDLFFNSLSINNPVITTQPATGTQSYCIGATPTNLTVAASGSGLSYQWFSNIAASNAGGTNLGSSSGAQTATYTPQNSTANTLYYYCVVTGGCSSTLVTSNVSGAITVKALPTPTFTVEPGATACATNDVSYTTQSGQTNYIWTVPGVLNTDYSITSGGVGTGSNTVTLKWLTTGSKTVTINYTTNGCTATSATSSTATTISAAPAPTFTAQPGATVCASTDVTYTTQSGQTNYVWTVPGVLNTDYSITSGSIGTGSNTVTLKWLTIGSKTVTINYTTSGCTAGTATSSTATTVSALPTPTFTAQPGAAACLGTDVTYTTQSGQTNYIWTVPGVLSTDYSITSGGIGTSSNTVTLKWLTSGSKTITINYTTSGCTAASATSSTATTVSATAPTAVAGPDISQCNSGAFTMAANAASPGTGTWTVVSGTAIITSANSTTSTITGVPFDTSATLRWTITNSPCSPTQDDIVVTNSSTNTWIGGTSTDWNTGANWCGGVPTSGSNVVIPSGTSFSPSIYQTANAVANSVNIANGASLSMSNAYALSITSGGSITTNSSGTFTAGDGTVNFIGSGTITGTVAFYNVNLSGLVAFSNAVTVNNRLRIATGGAVTTNSPTYGSGSLLQYFVGASYNRSLEWTSATSGAGYPANVQISTNSTNTTLNMLTTSAQCSGNLTIDSGNTLNTTSNILTVVGNVLINGTMSLGGDVYTRGNWTVGASGTQANNTKAVFFTAATGDQMVAKTGGGTVFFDYLIIDKVTSGNVVIESTTNITLNTATGQVLQLNNAGGLDLNGRALTFNNSGGAIYVNGARNIISTPSSPNGTIEINQYKVIQNNSGTGTLNLGPTVTVNLNTNGNLDFGSNITTVNGILSINSNTNCFVNTNPPIYSTTSTLIYNTGSNRNRSVEWNATSGAGYPNNMIVQNNTTLNVKNGDNSYKKIAGSLTITTGSSFVITDLTTTTPSAIDITGVGVEIVGDILNNGTITLNGTTDTRLKGFNFVNGYSNNTATTTLSGSAGGDIEVKGDFTDNAIFTVSQRAIFFTGTATQNVSGTASSPFNIDYMVVAKASGSGPVLLNKDLLVGGPLTGSVITFVSTADIIDLNGFTLTVGSSGVTNSIAGSGSFKGSGSSNLVINGVGDIGTIYFDQTTPGTTNVLNNLTVNRTSTGGGFSLGNDVNISNQLTLTNGTINLASANMTLGSSAPAISVASPSATNMIIASGTGELRKTFSTAGSYTFPIGDNVGTSEYSPATLTFSGNPSGYAGVRVQDAKHPNINSGIVDFISRYWPVSSTISSSSCTASFTYLASDENGTVANYFGGRYLNPDWYCLSDVDDTNRVISSTVGAFGDFTIYTPPAMTSALTTSAATICANTSTNLQVAIGGGDAPYTVGPYTVVYNDSVLATNITVNSYTSGANISVSPTAATTYTLVSVTSSKACSSVASDTKTVTIGGTSTYVSSAWSPSAPTATSTAVIDGLGVGDNYNVAADITACSLHVKNGAIVTIPSTFKITLSGALTVESGSSFILENDSNLVQTGGTTNPNSGSIQVNRNSSSLYLLDYTLWSSPVENQNLYSFSPRTLGNRFYVFDTPTNLYNPIASSNNFTVAKGYLIRVPKNFSSTTPAIYEGLFTGKPNSGTINFALSNQGPTIYSNPPLNTIVDVPATAAVKGFNAVGNPYPSQINVHNFIDANISNITGTLYFWRKKNDQTQPSYSTLTKLGYVANSAPGEEHQIPPIILTLQIMPQTLGLLM
ncbi:hypothetical protein ACFQZF_06660 [Flavobacterium myungsuense]